MRVSDQVIALDFGRMIANGKPHEVRANRDVVRAYLGSAN
jgi:branched-chain amino acid transport system ATP-binding protein